MNRIVYKNDDSSIAVIIPTPEAVNRFGIEKIAEKDVPSGLPYKIISKDDIPADRTDRNLWTIDDSELTDGIGGESNEFN